MSSKSQSSGRRICMITHSFYESDNRVIRYAETLARRGDTVDIVALRRKAEMPLVEVINGVTLHRVQDRFGKNEKSKASFLWPLIRFLFASARWLTKAHRKQRYDLIHVHNIPDFMVFAAWYPRLTGAKVILDIHDIVPEFFGSKFATKKGSLLVWGLKVVEKLSAAMAHHVILANHLWLEKYTTRSARPEKCSVFINHVDERIFHTRPRMRKGGPPVIMFPGGLQWHQGLDIAIRAFDKLRRKMPAVEFHIYGDGNMKPQLVEQVKELGLNDSVKFFNPMRIQEIAAVMADADLGVVPKRADSFGNEAYSTKIMEFMSLGVPMVVSSTKIDRYYFDNSVVKFFESGNDTLLAEAMYEVLSNDTARAEQIRCANEYVARNSWEQHQQTYLKLVDSLIGGQPLPQPAAALSPAGEVKSV